MQRILSPAGPYMAPPISERIVVLNAGKSIRWGDGLHTVTLDQPAVAWCRIPVFTLLFLLFQPFLQAADRTIADSLRNRALKYYSAEQFALAEESAQSLLNLYGTPSVTVNEQYIADVNLLAQIYRKQFKL